LNHSSGTQSSLLSIELLIKEIEMNWDVIEGNWTQYRNQVKAQWGKLTDNCLDVIAGKRDHLAGKIQEAYGIGREEVEKQLKAFEKYLKDSRPS
jgi:uncharacterized protein YjbJ (UPF0337 family)